MYRYLNGQILEIFFGWLLAALCLESLNPEAISQIEPRQTEEHPSTSRPIPAKLLASNENFVHAVKFKYIRV